MVGDWRIYFGEKLWSTGPPEQSGQGVEALILSSHEAHLHRDVPRRAYWKKPHSTNYWKKTKFNKLLEETKFNKLLEETKFNKLLEEIKFNKLLEETKFNKLQEETINKWGSRVSS